MADGAHLVFDEGHNQAGDSATRTLLAPAAERAAWITYSTATAGRDLRNLSSYASVFPWLSSMGDSDELPRGLGLAVAEASVREACARGLVVRREHDLSNMRLNVVEDRERMGRNEALAEALAPVLSGMARLGSRVYAIAEERNARNREAVSELPPGKRRAASEVWFSHNFGAKLNAIVGQFLVALKVDMTVSRCVEDIRAGRKPVVVIESTMESLLREFNRPPDAGLAGQENDEDAQEYEVEDSLEGQETPQDGGRVPTFGDALRLMAERMLRVSVRRGGPDGEREVIDLGDGDEGLAAARNGVVALAAGFPDLPLSPIDDIRERIEEEGERAHAAGEAARPWVADEISARSARVREGRYEAMPARDRNVTVARFNNGEIDALVLTTAASTGLSLHDAAHLPVQAARRMYELRPPRNVIQRVQMWGRVFRRGQRTEPDFFVLSSGLDAETFDLAVQNRKVQALSASVAGDAASGAVVAARDYEDASGNDIAHDILMEHPHLARDMAISLSVPREEGDRSLFWISKLLRRLWLVGKADREFLYGALTAAYEERVRSGLARAGDGGRLEGTWRPLSRRLVERGDGFGNPLTAGNVYLTEVCSTVFRDPVGTEELRHLVREAAAGFARKVDGLAERLEAGRGQALLSVLHAPWRSVDKALRAEDANPVKRMAETVSRLSWYARNARPGVGGVFPGEDGEPERGVLVDMLPGEGAAARSPREWLLSYVLPGDEEVRVVSLDVMLRDPRFRVGNRQDAAALRPEFDRCAPGTALVSRKILDGSPLGTLAAARRLGGGRREAFSDLAGNEREGVLLPKSLATRVASVPGVASTARAAEAVLADGGRGLLRPGGQRARGRSPAEVPGPARRLRPRGRLNGAGCRGRPGRRRSPPHLARQPGRGRRDPALRRRTCLGHLPQARQRGRTVPPRPPGGGRGWLARLRAAGRGPGAA